MISFHRFHWRVLLVGLFASCSGACAGGRASAQAQPSGPEQSPVVEAPTTIVRPGAATSIDEELRHGERRLEAGKYDEAARHFELLVGAAQRPSERLRALWGWGTALDLGGRPGAALEVYSRYVAESPPGVEQAKGQVRLVRLLTYLERYQEAAQRARRVDLALVPQFSQIALFSAMALAELEAGQLEAAESSIGRARSIVENEGIERLSRLPLDVAALYFALGEFRRLRAEAIGFDPLPSDFSRALEERCQWILDAQSAYSLAMKSEDAHWSSMAGVRVSDLYHQLHRDLTGIASPDAKTEAERQLFEGAMRLRYSILLRKASSMLRATVALQERTEQDGVWSRRAREALERIDAAERQEERAIDALPYSREQLQQVLDRMAARAQQSDQS